MNSNSQNSNPAVKYLRDYQEACSAITGFKNTLNVDVSKELDGYLKNEDLVNQIKNVHNLESLDDYRKQFISPFLAEEDHLKFLGDQIIQFNNLTNNSEISNLPIGQLPTSDLNASAIKTDEGHRLIVLNLGIVGLMSEILNSFIGAVIKPLWPIQVAMMRIIQWITYTSTGIPRYGLTKTPTFTDINLIMISGTIGATARAFILAHEISHFVLGHLNDANTKKRQLFPNSKLHPIEFYLKEQEQEFEADAKGFEYCIEWCKNTQNGESQVAFISIIFVFHVLKLMEINRINVDNFLTHPPADSRRKRLEEIHGSCFTENTQKQIKSLDDIMNKIYLLGKKILDTLFHLHVI